MGTVSFGIPGVGPLGSQVALAFDLRIVVNANQAFKRRIERLIQMTQAGSPEISAMTYAAAKEYVRYMRANYLSGQRLQIRTGDLISSWHAEKRDGGRAVITPGRNKYWAVHEYGIHAGQYVRGYVTARGVSVAGYQRIMRLTARHYVRDTLRYGSPKAFAEMQRMVGMVTSGSRFAYLSTKD